MDCGFYEEIKPTAQKGSEVQAEESPGGVWKSWLLPGTDTSLHQAHSVPPCFDIKKKIDFIRELDLLGCNDIGLMSIKILAKVKENEMLLSAESWLALELLASGFVSGSSDYNKILAKLGKLDRLKISELIEMAQILKVTLEDYLNLIDRMSIALYTKEVEGLDLSAFSRMKSKKFLQDSLRILASAEVGLGWGYNENGYNMGVYG